MLGMSLRPPRRPRMVFGRDAVSVVGLLRPALLVDLDFALAFLRGGMARAPGPGMMMVVPMQERKARDRLGRDWQWQWQRSKS